MARWLGAALAGFAVCGCGWTSDSSCNSKFEYHVVVPVGSHAGAVCGVTLSSGSKVASYAFPPLPVSVGAPCENSGTPPPCQTSAGSPTATSCGAWACLLFLDFEQSDAEELLHYLGELTFTMTATCNGLVIDEQTVEPDLGSCAM